MFNIRNCFLVALLGLFCPLIVQAVSISPVRQTAVIDPGSEAVIKLEVTNDSSESIVLSPQIDAFRVNERTGRAIFGAVDQAKQWVSALESEIILEAQEKKEIIFNIKVPKEAEPGGHYLALFVNNRPGEGNVGVASRVGSLLFLHVAGEIYESLVREVFFTNKKWYINDPVELFLKLENKGTIHLVPEGEIAIQTSRGRIIERKTLNLNNRKVLPGYGWYEDYSFDNLDLKAFGKLQAIAYIQYGATNQQIIDTISFWYLPWQIPVLIITIFIFSLFLIVLFRNRQKKLLEKQKKIE